MFLNPCSKLNFGFQFIDSENQFGFLRFIPVGFSLKKQSFSECQQYHKFFHKTLKRCSLLQHPSCTRWHTVEVFKKIFMKLAKSSTNRNSRFTSPFPQFQFLIFIFCIMGFNNCCRNKMCIYWIKVVVRPIRLHGIIVFPTKSLSDICFKYFQIKIFDMA